MDTDNMFFGRRIRQNHALEHATITILSGMVPDLRVSARSSSSGFIILVDVISLITAGTLLGMASSHTRTRIASTAVSSVAGLMAARPLGELVQKHFTTLPDLVGVRVTDIFRRTILGFTV